MKFHHNFVYGCCARIQKFKSNAGLGLSWDDPSLRRQIIMRLNLLFAIVLATFMQVSASTYAQKVTINEKNISLISALKVIRIQSGYDVLFDARSVQHVKPRDLNIKNADLEDALQKCLEGSNLTFKLEERTIIIKEKTIVEKLAERISTELNAKDIAGYVYANKGREALGGATVTVKRTKRSVYTNAKGQFEIKDVQPSDSLVISYIGFQPKTVAVGSQTTIYVNLDESSNPLDMLVVQGYGKTTQRLATGSIARVTATDIDKQILTNPIMALQGAVPGLEITSIDGNDFGTKRIELRGRRSINSNLSSEPLIILDGIPQTVLSNLELNLGVSPQSSVSSGLVIKEGGTIPATANEGFSPLYNINPGDIESIEVLKDADATAIYGSRGGNGVILITTKRGKSGKTAVDVNLDQGVRMVVNKWDLLNTEEYLTMRREAFKNDKITPTVANARELMLYDQNRYTDWQEFSYGGTGRWSTFAGNVSGGDAQTKFRLSSSLNHNKDITNYKGLNLRFSNAISLSHTTLNKRLKFDVNASHSHTKNDQITLRAGHLSPPNAPSVFDDAGALNFGAWRTPMAEFIGLKHETAYKGAAINASAKVQYNLIDNLNLSVSLGYNQNESDSKRIIPLSSFDRTSTVAVAPRITLGHTDVKNIIIEPQATYQIAIGRGRLETLAGASYQDNSTSNNLLSATGFTSDEQMSSINGATTITSTEALRLYKYAGVFARINYNWENKYVINLNGRRDGSSRFGEDYRFGNFGSVGATWILSEEKWMQSILPKAINFVKLRASYGVVGTDGIGDYKYLSQWGYLNYNGGKLVPYDGVTAVAPQLQPNSEFHWQRNVKSEIGLSLAFFQERINLEVSRYSDFTNNQLLQFPTPNYTGFNTMTFNSPAEVQNKGIELRLGASIIKTKNVTWSGSFNISKNTNILKDYPHFELSPYYNYYKIGQSLNNVYVFKSLGVNPQTGEFEFVDHNGDGKIQSTFSVPAGTNGDDRFVAVNTSPEFFGGITQFVQYKSVSLSANFFYSKQKGSLNVQPGDNRNLLRSVYENTWRNPGDQAKYAKLTTITKASNNNFSSSDARYLDTDFLRLQSVQLSYRMPAKMLSVLKVSNLSINATAQNIFVISKYKGLDPEVRNESGLPQTRTVTMGLKCTF